MVAASVVILSKKIQLNTMSSTPMTYLNLSVAFTLNRLINFRCDFR